MDFDSIYADTHCEQPIEQLFKAIYIMQHMAELDKETERLRRRLERFFKKVPEKDGVRVYDNTIYYYPSGVCQWRLHYSDVSSHLILLAAWRTEYVPPEPETEETAVAEDTTKKKPRAKRKPIKEAGLRNERHIWYVQLRLHEGRPYSVGDSRKYNLKELVKKNDIYNGLDEESRKMLDTTHSFADKLRKTAKDLYFHLRRYAEIKQTGEWEHHNIPEEKINAEKVVFPFLMPDELKTLRLVCDEAYELNELHKKRYGRSRTDLGYHTESEVKKFLKDIDMDQEGRVTLDISGVVKKTLTPHEVKKWDYQTDKYYNETMYEEHIDYRNIFSTLAEQIREIEDENVLKIIKDFGLDIEPLEEKEIPEETPELELVSS